MMMYSVMPWPRCCQAVRAVEKVRDMSEILVGWPMEASGQVYGKSASPYTTYTLFHCRYRSAALVPLGRVVGVGVFPRLAGPEPDRLRWGRPTRRVRHRQAHRQRRRVAGAPTTSGSEMPVFLVSRHQGQAALAVHAVIGDPDPVAFRIDLDVDSLDIDIGISIGISGARDRFGQSGGDGVAEGDFGGGGRVGGGGGGWWWRGLFGGGGGTLGSAADSPATWSIDQPTRQSGAGI